MAPDVSWEYYKGRLKNCNWYINSLLNSICMDQGDG